MAHIRGLLIDELKLGDALILTKELPDESIDAVISNPPYFALKDVWDAQWRSVEEYFAWFDVVFYEVMRVLKQGGQAYVFFSQKYVFEYGARYKPKRMLVWWHRDLSSPTNTTWLYQYDPIFWHVKGVPKMFNGGFGLGRNTDVFEYPKPQMWLGRRRFHPAE